MRMGNLKRRQFCLKLEQEKSIGPQYIDDKLLNEYTISGLATLAFPALFPDGKGNPTNPCLHRDVPFNERIKHLLKFAETLTISGLLQTLDFHIGL